MVGAVELEEMAVLGDQDSPAEELAQDLRAPKLSPGPSILISDPAHQLLLGTVEGDRDEYRSSCPGE